MPGSGVLQPCAGSEPAPSGHIDPMAMSPVDSVEAARAVGLRYVSDDRPGYGRRRSGTGFTYLDQDGSVIRDRRLRARIRALVIPPAWQHVWICPDARGHIQATGRDARGESKYRYHPDWRSLRDATKYDRLAPSGRAGPRSGSDRLGSGARRPAARPRARRRARPDRRTLIRIGNDEYARTTTLRRTTIRNEHARSTRRG